MSEMLVGSPSWGYKLLLGVAVVIFSLAVSTAGWVYYSQPQSNQKMTNAEYPKFFIRRHR